MNRAAKIRNYVEMAANSWLMIERIRRETDKNQDGIRVVYGSCLSVTSKLPQSYLKGDIE